MRKNKELYLFNLPVNIIKLNIDDMYKLKFDAIKKYENLFEISLSNKDMDKYKLIELFDKYILQILEEIQEAYEEYIKLDPSKIIKIKFTNIDLNNIIDSTEKKLFNEIVDILGYLYSFGSLISWEYYELNMTEIFDEECYYKYSILISNDYNLSIDKFLLNIMDEVIKFRQLFPERKWHKKPDDYAIEDVLKIGLLKINKIIGDIYLFLLNYIDVEDIINRKVKYINVEDTVNTNTNVEIYLTNDEVYESYSNWSNAINELYIKQQFIQNRLIYCHNNLMNLPIPERTKNRLGKE